MVEIPPSFTKDFPRHAAKAKEHDIFVHLHSPARNGRQRVYFIENNHQVTGFTTRKLEDGTVIRWTANDSDRYIGETLDSIISARAAAELLTPQERFDALMVDAMKAWPPIGMIGTHAPHSGDSVTFCDWRRTMRCICHVRLRGIGDVVETDYVTHEDAPSAMRAAFAAYLRAAANGP